MLWTRGTRLTDHRVSQLLERTGVAAIALVQDNGADHSAIARCPTFIEFQVQTGQSTTNGHEVSQAESDCFRNQLLTLAQGIDTCFDLLHLLFSAGDFGLGRVGDCPCCGNRCFGRSRCCRKSFIGSRQFFLLLRND